MKGIETSNIKMASSALDTGSDHCPAMKGIETKQGLIYPYRPDRSDHCPAMKGIETAMRALGARPAGTEATTAPQ